MANQFIIRRTTAEWTADNPVLLANQLGVESNIVDNVETDTLQAKLGNGIDHWDDLPYWQPSDTVADVAGPASSTDNAITRFNGTTGKAVQNSAAFVDDNGNVYAPNVAPGFATTATAAGTTTLTVASKGRQTFTGVTTQTVVLPVVATLPQTGFGFDIINNSTGALTINSSGGNLVQTVGTGARVTVFAILLTGTSDASWGRVFYPATTTAGYISMSPIFRVEAGANDYLQGSASVGTNYYAATTGHQFLVGAALNAVQFDATAVAGNTRMLLYDVDNGQVERVSVGIADSGGAGFKLLRIPN